MTFSIPSMNDLEINEKHQFHANSIIQPFFFIMSENIALGRSNSHKIGDKNSTSKLIHRALSTRSNKSFNTGPTSIRYDFSLSSLRGTIQPELSKKLYKMIKTEKNVISSYDTVAKQQLLVASQLSDWGESTKDNTISCISSKISILLSELGELERSYARCLDNGRSILKTIRNTEKSIQPSRDAKAKVLDEISRLKAKDPGSARLITSEQEYIRAEAENLVAEAQLTNITRSKLKHAYMTEFAAIIERAEKQIIIASHGFRLLSLLDDSPILPGDRLRDFQYAGQARQVINDVEDDLKEWQPENSGDYFHPNPLIDNKSNPDFSHRPDQANQKLNGIDNANHETDTQNMEAENSK
ncbi:Sphingolipid long chain base-responsive protein LSP1 [Erysiphe neolycopersici]|uniref:Sphingolipid long chain base-responsive protein LSP1 n=1 Tax=Erysiphe neolycopersici TaxID=212602 RepID=A0A420HY00_9PEZI|nr:Sphingolipid long chain base-responsive protein LSP1 [Erysiphe neolycopersici]